MSDPRLQTAGYNRDDRLETACPRGSSLPRSARLLDASAFERVFASPTRSADRYFTVLVREREAANGQAVQPLSGGPRLGLAISKRCAARAVARNRIKRVIRESFRHARCALPDVDVVVLCRRAAVDADKRSLRSALGVHWKRIGKRIGKQGAT